LAFWGIGFRVFLGVHNCSSSGKPKSNQIKTGDLVPLSEQQLLDCDVDDQGCSGNGDWDRAFTYIQQSPGIATEEECPLPGDPAGVQRAWGWWCLHRWV